MAKDKKGFVLYADQKELFDQLSDEKAGELIKHIFKYVNDENPKQDDPLIRLAFTPIRQQLKRDLVKYNNICDRNRINGMKGGRPKQPTGLSGNPKKPKEPDTDNDTDTGTDKENDNVTTTGEVFEKLEQWLIGFPEQVTNPHGYAKKLMDVYGVHIVRLTLKDSALTSLSKFTQIAEYNRKKK